MLKLKKNSVKLSKIVVFRSCFLVFIFINSCGFHLAEKKSWIGKAKSLRMEKIENYSRILGIDFSLKKKMEFRILQYPELNYTKNLADLNLSIKIIQADFSSSFRRQNNSDYYTHSQTLKVEILLRDLRNLAPAQKKLTFVSQVLLESKNPTLDNYEKNQLQQRNISDLADKIFTFLTSPNVPHRTLRDHRIG